MVFLSSFLLLDFISTMVSTTTNVDGQDEAIDQSKPPQDNNRWTEIPTLENPITAKKNAECAEYKVIGVAFIATCRQEMDESVLEATTCLIKDAREQPDAQDIALASFPEPASPNPDDPEQWHHRYAVSFPVFAKKDPQEYLADYFSRNILQLEDAAVRIAYVEAIQVL